MNIYIHPTLAKNPPALNALRAATQCTTRPAGNAIVLSPIKTLPYRNPLALATATATITSTGTRAYTHNFNFNPEGPSAA